VTTSAIEPAEKPEAGEPVPSRKAPGRSGDSRPPRKSRSAYPELRGSPGDGDARRLCAVILEVLAGGRTPTEAAEVLGVSVPRYYALEARALGGLLKACGRKPKGRTRTPEGEVVKLQGEVKRLEGQCSRLQALLRTSQRALGLSPQPAAKAKEARAPGKRRRRGPVVRALRAARVLSSAPGGNLVEASGEKGEDRKDLGP
jgi:hypothetical protein